MESQRSHAVRATSRSGKRYKNPIVRDNLPSASSSGRRRGLESSEQTPSARTREEGRERFEADDDFAGCQEGGSARITGGESFVCVVWGAIVARKEVQVVETITYNITESWYDAVSTLPRGVGRVGSATYLLLCAFAVPTAPLYIPSYIPHAAIHDGPSTPCSLAFIRVEPQPF